MSNIALISATIKASLEKIADQALALGQGLENAAPGKDVPNKSILYLRGISEEIKNLIESCEAFPVDSNEKKFGR